MWEAVCRKKGFGFEVCNLDDERLKFVEALTELFSKLLSCSDESVVKEIIRNFGLSQEVVFLIGSALIGSMNYLFCKDLHVFCVPSAAYMCGPYKECLQVLVFC